MDTNVAIYVRDANPEISTCVSALGALPALSILSWAEMEGGVYSHAGDMETRRKMLDVMLVTLTILPFAHDVVHAYRDIVAARGFVRSRILDRLIAATAIVHDLKLITINAADFRDIPGLKLEIWPNPAAAQ